MVRLASTLSSNFGISKPKIFVIQNAKIIGRIIDHAKSFAAVENHLCQPQATEKLNAWIGRKSGAINIAQITTSTECCNNDNVAITLDKNISIQ